MSLVVSTFMLTLGLSDDENAKFEADMKVRPSSSCFVCVYLCTCVCVDTMVHACTSSERAPPPPLRLHITHPNVQLNLIQEAQKTTVVSDLAPRGRLVFFTGLAGTLHRFFLFVCCILFSLQT